MKGFLSIEIQDTRYKIQDIDTSILYLVSAELARQVSCILLDALQDSLSVLYGDYLVEAHRLQNGVALADGLTQILGGVGIRADGNEAATAVLVELQKLHGGHGDPQPLPEGGDVDLHGHVAADQLVVDGGDLVVVGLEVQLFARQSDVAVHVGQVSQGGDALELDHLQRFVQRAVKELLDEAVAHVAVVHEAEIGDVLQVMERADDELVGVGIQHGAGGLGVLGGVTQLDAADHIEPSLVFFLDLHHGVPRAVRVKGEVVELFHLAVDVAMVGEGDVRKTDLQGAAAHGVVGGGGVAVEGKAGVGVIITKKHTIPRGWIQIFILL